MTVQAFNPITGRWVKIDTKTGCIIGHKKTLGAYKGIESVNKYFKWIMMLERSVNNGESEDL